MFSSSQESCIVCRLGLNNIERSEDLSIHYTDLVTFVSLHLFIFREIQRHKVLLVHRLPRPFQSGRREDRRELQIL